MRQQESLAVLLRDEIQKPQNQTKKFNRWRTMKKPAALGIIKKKKKKKNGGRGNEREKRVFVIHRFLAIRDSDK